MYFDMMVAYMRVKMLLSSFSDRKILYALRAYTAHRMEGMRSHSVGE
jgi:hypothetical protein